MPTRDELKKIYQDYVDNAFASGEYEYLIGLILSVEPHQYRMLLDLLQVKELPNWGSFGDMVEYLHGQQYPSKEQREYEAEKR